MLSKYYFLYGCRVWLSKLVRFETRVNLLTVTRGLYFSFCSNFEYIVKYMK